MRASISNLQKNINIIVVNQDLLIRDILRKQETGKGFIDPNPALVIIDEAHNLEDKVRSAMTIEYSLTQIEDLLDRATDAAIHKNYTTELRRFLKTNTAIFEKMNQDIEAQKGYLDSEADRYKVADVDSIAIHESIQFINDVILSLSLQLASKNERDHDDLIEELKHILNMYEILAKQTDRFLIWLTQHGENAANISIHYCPKNIQQYLKNGLFNQPYPVIMTSATLCQHGDSIEEKYKYIADAVGFEGDFSEPIKSPYDYANNSILYISSNVSHYDATKKYSYLDDVIYEIKRLCDLTSGRSMVLFTAKEDLRYVTEKFKYIATTWSKHFQVEGAFPEQLIQDFKRSKGVIFATGVFWEGIDIKGPDLSQVILVRLPFPVSNDPIMEYKTSIVQDPMQEVLIPNMLIKLRQGAGRLIRGEDDRGILSILDSRLSEKYNKQYRKLTLESLQQSVITESFAVVSDFSRKKIISTSISQENGDYFSNRLRGL